MPTSALAHGITRMPVFDDTEELENRRERQAAGITTAKERGTCRGRQKGTTKTMPARALALRKRDTAGREMGSVDQRVAFTGLWNKTSRRHFLQYRSPPL